MAEDDKTIVIEIQVRDGEGEGGEKTPEKETKEAEKKANDKANPAKALVTKLAKKTATTILSNYGNLTGDYIAQQNLQGIVGEATALVGAVALGWVGVALYAVDKVFEVYNYIGNIKRSERDAKFKQERLGFSIEKS